MNKEPKRKDTVTDLIPSNSKRAKPELWGALISKYQKGRYSFDPIDLSNEEETFSKFRFASILSQDSEVDRELFQLLHDSENIYLLSLQDDIFINGIVLSKEFKQKVVNGDEVSVGVNSFQSNNSDSLSFIVQVYPVNNNLPLVEAKRDPLEENLSCPVCFNIYYKPVLSYPCLHTLCGSCFIQCHKRNNKCVMCRGKVIGIKPNWLLDQFVQIFLDSNPTKRLTPEDIALRDSHQDRVEILLKSCNSFNPIGLFKKKTWFDANSERKALYKDIYLNNDNEGESEDSFNEEDYYSDQIDSDEDEVPDPSLYAINYPTCPFCVIPNDGTDRFVCPTGQEHLNCTTCYTPYPAHFDTNIRCDICADFFCPSCVPALPSPTNTTSTFHVSYIKDYVPNQFPSTWFWNNPTEHRILARYLMASNYSPEQFYNLLISQVTNNELNLSEALLPPSINLDSLCCKRCIMTKVYTEMAFLFRKGMDEQTLIQYNPSNEPRDKCWYGRQCNTQFNRPAHQVRLNHCCLPTRTAIPRNP